MASTEEPTLAAVAEVTSEPAVVVSANVEKTEVKTKAAKEPKAKKVAAPKKPRSPSAHPPYAEMIQEAITALKERTGSSPVAIAKFIEEKQKNLPGNFRKLLSIQLKKLVASGKLTKVKSSFKLSSTKPAAPAKKKPAVAAKAKAPVAKKKAPIPKAHVAPAKPKAKAVVKPKAKAKAPVVKAKAEVRKAPRMRATGGMLPVPKVAKTSAKSTPGRKPPTARAAPPAKKAAKKAPVKKTAKTVKSPVKKAAATRRGNK